MVIAPLWLPFTSIQSQSVSAIENDLINGQIGDADIPDDTFNKTYLEWLHFIDTCSFLNDDEVKIILTFINTEEPISPFELQLVEDVSLDKLKLLIEHLRDREKEVDNYLESGSWSIQMTNKAAFTSIQDLKSKKVHAQLIRLRAVPSSSTEFGLTIEKDAGESYWRKEKGIEYLSGFLRFKTRMRSIPQILIGDYRLRIGQGLLINNYYRKSLSLSPSSIPKYDIPDIAPYTSIDEQRALRGVAFQMKCTSKLTSHFCMSYRQLDARMNEHSDTIISLVQTGYHKTSTEVANKDILTSLTVANSWNLNVLHGIVGLNFLYQKFGLPLGTGQELYKSKSSISRGLSGSLSFDQRFSNLNLYGEIALTSDLHSSLVLMALWSPHKHHKIHLGFRQIASAGRHYLSQSFSQSQSGDETGLSLSYIYHITPFITFNLSGHSHVRRWWSYTNSPFRISHQIRNSILIKRRKKHSLAITLNYLNRMKDRNLNLLPTTIFEKKWDIKIHFEKVLSKGVLWRTRFHCNHYQAEGNQWGWLAYQEIKAKPLGAPYSLVCRVSKFSVGQFENRIYTYEIRPGNISSFPAYQGQGTSVLFQFSYKIGAIKSSLYYSISDNGEINKQNIGISLSYSK